MHKDWVYTSREIEDVKDKSMHSLEFAQTHGLISLTYFDTILTLWRTSRFELSTKELCKEQKTHAHTIRLIVAITGSLDQYHYFF